MRRVNINPLVVQADIADDHTQPSSFNTSFHSSNEYPPNTPVFLSEAPYSFKRWLPLIMYTRNQNPATALQTIPLTVSQARLLLDAATVSAPFGHINRTYLEDLHDEILKPVLSNLVFPPEGLFLRLDLTSAKDGVHAVRGRMALQSSEEVLLRIVTSQRAKNAFSQILQDDAAQQTKSPVELYFLPFDKRMSSENEYRVFCRPEDGAITGISQYQWHKEWKMAGLEREEQDEVVGRIVEGAKELRRLILEDVDCGGKDGSGDRLMMAQGFSFDVLYDESTGGCELVELNPFGAGSPCGSCLFHWVKDWNVLYGQAPGEFRVAVAGAKPKATDGMMVD
jgi:hypothetical protein